MRITDLLRAESIQLNASPADKAAAVDPAGGPAQQGGQSDRPGPL